MLHEVTARLRPRTGWESQDLGLAMVRGMIGRLLVQWLVVLVPLWALLTFLLWDRPILLLFILWWLKPVYDRLPLFSLGRRLFGQQTKLRDVLRAAPKLLLVGNIYFLTFGRFSFYRSFSMPVKVLEGGKFSAYRRRVSTLLRVGDSTVFWVTFAWFITTILGVIGCYLFLDSWSGETESSPAEMWARFTGRGWRDADLELWRTIAMLYLFVVTLTEPFYVGSGFGLYINARSHLEGWDIEVAFRALSSRIQQSMVAPLLICSLIFFQSLSSAQAQDDPKEIIDKVKAHPDFKVHQEEITVNDDVFSPSNLPSTNFDGSFLSGLAVMAKIVFWVLIALLVGYLIYLIVKNRHLFVRSNRGAPPPEPKARVVLGLDVTAEALPADIAAAARERWLAGDIYGALRLLYAGSLSWMIQRASLPIRESDTEGDCVRHSKKLWDPNQISYFQQLTQAWVRNAYGKKSPMAEEMEQFVTQWPFLK